MFSPVFTLFRVKTFLNHAVFSHPINYTSHSNCVYNRCLHNFSISPGLRLKKEKQLMIVTISHLMTGQLSKTRHGGVLPHSELVLGITVSCDQLLRVLGPEYRTDLGSRETVNKCGVRGVLE